MIILMPRLGCPHILKFKRDDGNLITRCDKILPKDITMITLAADDTYSQLCRICRDHQDEMTLEELNYYPRTARNVFESHLYNLRSHLQNEEVGPKDTFYYLTSRRWSKINKIKKIIKKR